MMTMTSYSASKGLTVPSPPPPLPHSPHERKTTTPGSKSPTLLELQCGFFFADGVWTHVILLGRPISESLQTGARIENEL